MKETRIRAHSLIDVITNSSTEIFTSISVETLPSIKELIDMILRLGGSEKTFDDVFDYRVDHADEDSAIEQWMDDQPDEFEEHFGEEDKKVDKLRDTLGWGHDDTKAARVAMDDRIKAYLGERIFEYGIRSEYGDTPETDIVLIPKNGEDSFSLISRVHHWFDEWAEFC